MDPLTNTPVNTPIDLLWRNLSPTSPAFGKNIVWNLSGSANLAGPEYRSYRELTQVADANWSVAAVADYNRDGNSDYLWRNSETGMNLWWEMDANGTGILKITMLTSVPTDWTIVGAIDANRDQDPDILWRNTKTGSHVWWHMQGAQIKTVKEIQGLAALDWDIKGVGDVDQNGAIDIFWSHQTTGTMVWWLMNDTTQGATIQSSLTISADPKGGRAQAIADFNSDGQFDIVLRNFTTGENTLWIMDRDVVLDSYALTTLTDSNWQLDALVPRNKPVGNPPVLSTNGVTDPIPGAVKDGPRFFDRHQLNGKTSATGTDKIYSFKVTESGIFTANLTGLTQDADVQLIQDSNGNGFLDAGESVLALEWQRGTTRESLRTFIQTGSYLIQVKNYSLQAAQYSLSSNFLAALSDPQAFKIQLNFKTGTETLSLAARNAIVSAAQFWENAIVTSTGITQLKNLSIDILGGTIADPNTLAYASPYVTTDGVKILITSAEATLNLSKYSIFNNDPAYLRGIMIHEFAHALGLGTLWTPIDFGGTRGKVGRSWIDAATATYTANSYAGYAYGNLLGVDGAVAVPIDRADLSHWDETRFDTELLTPYTEGSGVPMPVSVLTLAALRDLGWRINLAAAQPYGLPVVAPVVVPESSAPSEILENPDIPAIA